MYQLPAEHMAISKLDSCSELKLHFLKPENVNVVSKMLDVHWNMVLNLTDLKTGKTGSSNKR